MKLRDLQLTNYRNCKELYLDLTPEKILIIGKNAQGKTNILESIYFLSCLKSSRTAVNTELINFNSNKVSINSHIVKADVDIELDFSYTRDKTRELRVNKVKTTPKTFKSILKTVIFSTNDLLLLRGSPSARRDWLDRAIAQIYPAYDERLSKYDKIRIQKNNCLRGYLKTGYLNDTLLDVYNEQLVITGSNLIFLRIKFLKEIESLAKVKHRIISNTEDLSVKYDCSFLNGETELNEIASAYKAALREKREEELRCAQSLIGPHRDDILFFINDNDALKYASQGQQRTIVLALKLSELDIITAKTGVKPVLLLDDVLAELDDLRQNYLLGSIDPAVQTIITSVDTVLFKDEFLKDVKIYNIENGILSRVTGQQKFFTNEGR